jgi:hypothetical protein
MADQTFDPRFESLLRSVLAAEVAQLPLTVRPERILERGGMRRRSGLHRLVAFPSNRGLLRLAVALVAIALLAAAAVVGSRLLLPTDLPPTPLPARPEAWSRFLIETPSGRGSIVSLAAGPHALLAVVGEDWQTDVAWLAVSNDGLNWTLVPEAQHPKLTAPNGFGPPIGYPSLVGTNNGFLLVQRRFDGQLWVGDVWRSENGYSWRRLTGEISHPDLSATGPQTAIDGGPGLVAVGAGSAAYSVDGSEWSVADVPALPEEILAQPAEDRFVELAGVTASGSGLIAWGAAFVPLAGNNIERFAVPLLWLSRDGRTWTSVVDPSMDSVMTVGGGPGGFVAAGKADGALVVWRSADGQSWEKVDELEDRSPIQTASVAGSMVGYVLVGGYSDCFSGDCRPSTAPAVWTSPDGRSWSRVLGDDRFARSGVLGVVAFGSQFVMGGGHEDQPTIWASDGGQSR